jgi:predicted metal-dependent phosphoesterase TrpH
MKPRTRMPALLIPLIALSLLGSPANAQASKDMPTRMLGAFPKVGRYNVLRGDFHMHTKHSDGSLTPQERVMEAWRLGKILAYDEAKTTAEALDIVLVRALETGVASKEHMVALGVPDGYIPHDSHRWAEEPGKGIVYYRDEMLAIQKTGGLLILAHPHVGYREPFEWGAKQGIIRGIEIKNDVVGKGWNTIESHGTWFYPHAFDKAAEYNLALFANTDAHGAKNPGQAVTLVFARERSAKSVLDAIRQARTVAWFDGMLWGRESLLTDLIKEVVKVRRTADDQYLRIENLSPLALKAAIQPPVGVPIAVELPPGSEVLVPSAGDSDTALIQWQNIWIGTSKNLSTTHAVRKDR